MKYKRHCEVVAVSLVLKDVYWVQSLVRIRQWTHFPTHSTNHFTEFVEIRREEVHVRTLMRFFCFNSELTFWFASFRTHLCILFRKTPFYVFRFRAHIWFTSLRGTFVSAASLCRLLHIGAHLFVYFISEYTFWFTSFRSSFVCLI